MKRKYFFRSDSLEEIRDEYNCLDDTFLRLQVQVDLLSCGIHIEDVDNVH